MNNENFDLENIQKLFKKLNIPDNYDPNKRYEIWQVHPIPEGTTVFFESL